MRECIRLWRVGNLKLRVTYNMHAIQIILKINVELNHRSSLHSQDYPDVFQWACSEIQVRDAMTQWLCLVAPCVTKLDQSCGAGSQACMVSAVSLFG